MSGKCIYCGFVGTNDGMEDHAGKCPVLLSEGKLVYKGGEIIMLDNDIRPMSDQFMGGTFTIPDGYYVYNVDLDSATPTCIIYKEDSAEESKQVLEIPKALAYYLTKHHNGSYKFRSLLRKDAQNELRSKIRDLFEYSDREIER